MNGEYLRNWIIYSSIRKMLSIKTQNFNRLWNFNNIIKFLVIPKIFGSERNSGPKILTIQEF